jgi:hypothetical protein
LEEKIDAATEIDRDEDEENVEEEISKVLAEATLGRQRLFMLIAFCDLSPFKTLLRR